MQQSKKTAQANHSVSSIRIRQLEAPTVQPDQIASLLREINNRQWGAVLEVLLEAKFKAESMLRVDIVYESPGKVAHYQGWVTYADYVIGSLESLRESEPLEPPAQPEPGPE